MKITRSSAPSDESQSGSPGTILETITNEIDESLTLMRTAASERFQAEFDMDWDLTNFLRGQKYDAPWETAVELAITLTGSNGKIQALTCMDYMCQTWPLSGCFVVRLLQKALVSPALSCSGFLVGGTEVEINLTSPRALIVARGSQAALTELCGQLSWLGAALRTSPKSSGIGVSTPTISVIRSSTTSSSVTVRIGYTDTDYGTSPDERSASCWQAMFLNPLIVNGFPILARPENEPGLELPLGMMSDLAETHFATHYGSTLVLKGPCTMLVPTYRAERSITWHFLFNEDGERIPYYSFRKRCPSWIGTDKVYIGLLDDRNMRHFVGWASHVTRHLGTNDMPYDKIDWSGAKICTAGLAVEQNISVGKILGGNGSLQRGSRDKPIYVNHSLYSVHIRNARRTFFVLYDVADHRGWLVDGASALLHLLRTQVVQEPYGGSASVFNNLDFNESTFNHPAPDGGPDEAINILKDENNMAHIALREFDSYADEIVPLGEESRFVGKKIYKTLSCKELVSQTWNTLEQLHDERLEASTHIIKQLQLPFQKKLEGVNVKLNGSWVDLIHQIHAVTLFARHLGEIYKPTDGAKRERWEIGHDYLVAPISLLQEIKQYILRKGKKQDKFEKMLGKISLAGNGPQSDEINGAILFGKNGVLDSP